jgi:hypothetical protein
LKVKIFERIHPTIKLGFEKKNGFSDLVSSLFFLIFALTLFIIILSGGAESAKRRTLSFAATLEKKVSGVRFLWRKGDGASDSGCFNFYLFSVIFLNEIETN